MLLKSMEHKRHPVFSKCKLIFFYFLWSFAFSPGLATLFAVRAEKCVKKTWRAKLNLIKTHHRICLAWNKCNSSLYNCVPILQNFQCCLTNVIFKKFIGHLEMSWWALFPPRQWFGQPLPYTLSNKNTFSNAATFKKN